MSSVMSEPHFVAEEEKDFTATNIGGSGFGD